MPQEKGWRLHGGDIHELWARVDGRVQQLTREAAAMGEAAAPPEAPEEPKPPKKSEG